MRKQLASSKTERTTNSIAQFVILVILTPTSLLAYDRATITRNHQPKILQLTTSSHSKLASIATNAIALLNNLTIFSENIEIEHTIKTQIEYL